MFDCYYGALVLAYVDCTSKAEYVTILHTAVTLYEQLQTIEAHQKQSYRARHFLFS